MYVVLDSFSVGSETKSRNGLVALGMGRSDAEDNESATVAS